METIIIDSRDYRVQFNFYRKVHTSRTATYQNQILSFNSINQTNAQNCLS